MKDFLGNEYGVGDKVIYAAMSGRSITMVFGEVTEIYVGPKDGYADWESSGFELTDDRKQTKVKVQPLKSSRWQQHYGRTRYVDTRTGKGIDPFSGYGKHMTGDYYERQSDGQRAYREDVYKYPEFPLFVTYYDWGAPDKTPEGWRFVKQEFKPYVKKIKEGLKPVTLSVTDNIVLWRKKEPGESHPEWKACKS